MTRYFKLPQFVILIAFALFQIIACNNNQGTDKKQEKKDTTANVADTSQTNAPTANLLSVTIDTLYVKASEFTSLPPGQRIFFTLVFLPSNKLTLHGWARVNPNDYDPDPKIKLQNGSATKLPGSNVLYIGNVKLEVPEVNAIKDIITKHNWAYVLFVPRDTVIALKHHLKYEIFVTNDVPPFKIIALTTPTGQSANPSPPKQG